MKIKRGYNDTTFQDCPPFLSNAFGQLVDGGKPTDVFRNNGAFGFDGPVSLAFTVSAGQAPFDAMLSAGSAHNVENAGKRVRWNLSEKPGDIGNAQWHTPDAQMGGFRHGYVKNKSHVAWPDVPVGETLYVVIEFEGGGGGWVVWNATTH